MLLIIVPAVCDEDGNPFGADRSLCRSRGLSYSSLSTAVSTEFRLKSIKLELISYLFSDAERSFRLNFTLCISAAWQPVHMDLHLQPDADAVQ